MQLLVGFDNILGAPSVRGLLLPHQEEEEAAAASPEGRVGCVSHLPGEPHVLEGMVPGPLGPTQPLSLGQGVTLMLKVFRHP